MLTARQTPAEQVPPPVQATNSSESPSAAQTARVRLSKQELVPGAHDGADSLLPVGDRIRGGRLDHEGVDGVRFAVEEPVDR